MKNALLILVLSFLINQVKSQDTISYELMKPLTHYFTIENGELTGEGADYLLKELSQTQHTMLGEYHGSHRISEFTAALIPELSNFGYRNMVVEVGPETGKYLNSLTGDIQSQLSNYYEKYKIDDPEDPEYPFVPFPFFDAAADIDFLQKLKEDNWKIYGADQEFYYGYVPLFDSMYEALPKRKNSVNAIERLLIL